MRNKYNNFRQAAFSGFIGVAQYDITPPVGIYNRNWAVADQDVASGIHRPLRLTCMSFQSAADQKPLFLFSADFCGWRSAEDGRALRAGILKALAIPATHLMFCLTHTHSGPILSRENETKPGGHLVADYLVELEESAIALGKEALSSAVSAVLTWEYGSCKLAANRDLRDMDQDRYLVGLNQDGHADDTLLVGRVTDSDQKIIGTIVNYGCHPTTLGWQNSLISPDYVGAMRELVSSATKAPCLFLQGASGEFAPAEQYTDDIGIADKHGRQLGYAVLSVLEGMLPPATELVFEQVVESGAPLALWKRRPYVPSNICSASIEDVSYDLKALPSLKELEQQYNECEDRVTKERLWRQRAIRINFGDGDSVNMPLWIWELGESLLVGQSNEAYSAFQTEVRKQLSPTPVAVMNLVNGSAGYLPPSDLYHKNIYPVWQSPFAIGSLERLITTTLKATKKKVISNQ